MRSLASALLLISLLIYSVDVMAEGDSFFDKDYAGSPLESKKGESKHSDELVPLFPEKNITPTKEATVASQPTPTEAPPLLEGIETPVRAVGVLVNGLDTAHLLDVMTELSDLAIQKKVRVGRVLAICKPENLMLMAMRLGALDPTGRRGMEVLRFLEGAEELPEQYRGVITRSPTWVVETEKGEILLEGTRGVERYFTQTGNFADKWGDDPHSEPMIPVRPR
jgi:hypothetical protein